MRTSLISHSSKKKIKSIPVDKNVTILNLGHGKYMFKSPFPINITVEDDLFIASSFNLNLFGYGDSEDVAIRDLCDSIIEHYEHLKMSQENLGDLLKRDWEFLSRIILEAEEISCN